MGTTLRNIFLLLLFAVLATKGVEHFSKLGTGPSGEQARVVSGQNGASYEADESYIAHDQLVLRADRAGHFTVEASVDGTPIEFMVDTGASIIVLSPADAQRVGLDPASLDYNARFETGNGYTHFAIVNLDELTIDNLDLYNVQAAVNTKPMTMSLLGMNALDQLDGYEVEGDRMILRW